MSQMRERSPGKNQRRSRSWEWLSHRWRWRVFQCLLKKNRGYYRRYTSFTWCGSAFQPFLSLFSFGPDLCDGSHFFQGLDLLKRVGVLREEAQHLEMEGLGKNRGGSGRIGGRRSVQALEGSHIIFPCVLYPTPPTKCHHTQSATISKPPPQEPEAVPGASAPGVKESKLALEVPSTDVSQTLEVVIPAHMAPLCLQLGASRGCISAGWRV